MKMTSVSAWPTLSQSIACDGVAGDEGDGGGVLAMGERHAGVGGDAERRGDAGDDLERNAGIGQRLGLFAAAAEDERVAAFEADHGEAAARALDQHGADLVLRERVGGFLLADVEALGVRRRERQERVGGEVVVEDGVGLLEDAAAFEGEQFGIARAGADEVDLGHGAVALVDDLCRHDAACALGEKFVAQLRGRSIRHPRPAPSASAREPGRCRRAPPRSPKQCSAAIRDRGVRADRDLAAAAERGRARRAPRSRPRAWRHGPARGRLRARAAARFRWPARPARPPEHITSGPAGSRRSGPPQPSRFSPAAASTMASYWPSSSLRRRVSRLPRTDSMTRSGRRRRNCAARRSELVPDLRARAADRPASADDGVARILALGNRRQHQPVGQFRRQILQAVHGEIGAAVEQRLFDLLREQPLACRPWPAARR